MSPRMGWMAAAAFALLLSGCTSEERSKTVRLDKGGYKGPMDTELTSATRDVLSRRVALQGFGGGLQQALEPAQPWPATVDKVEGRIAGQRF